MSGASGNPKNTSNLTNYDERIIRDMGICGGEPVFKDTRVTRRTVLTSLAAEDSAEEIFADFPSPRAEDIQAAIAFAAASAEEDLPVQQFRTFDDGGWPAIQPAAQYFSQLVRTCHNTPVFERLASN